MENKKIIVKETKDMGNGVLAIDNIKKGEIIVDFSDGIIYQAERASELPDAVRNHAIQFEENKWIDTTGIGRYFNHSCEPNCGIKGKFQIVAMRDIGKGEWLTFDYEMTENSDWRIECKCNSKSCRRLIGAYKNMPSNLKKRYKDYTSQYLIKN